MCGSQPPHNGLDVEVKVAVNRYVATEQSEFLESSKLGKAGLDRF